MNPKTVLTSLCEAEGLAEVNWQFPDCQVEPAQIKVVMINEVPPQNPDDYFYSKTGSPDYMKTTLSLFHTAGVHVHSMEDILNLGIYITTAVKTPKTGYTVETQIIKAQLPILKAELQLFPNLQVIMLMGDVAKKAVNLLHKMETGKNLIPAEATYKIRQNEYTWNAVRVLPSYIMTGGNILIEKSKCSMIAEDIRSMMKICGDVCEPE